MKKHCYFTAISLLALLLSSASGQKTNAPKSTLDPSAEASQSKAQAAQSKAEAPKSKDDVVRISVTLVQVDAVVTDDKGKQVTDLKPEDFQILEDGRPHRITNFSYISNVSSLPWQP